MPAKGWIVGLSPEYRIRTAIVELCTDLTGTLSSLDARAAVTRVLRDYRERPLRVAVGGQVCRGKSTLINALLGRRLAPVLPGETPQVPTIFRQGPLGCELVDSSGGKRQLALDADGFLPLIEPPGDGTELVLTATVDAPVLDGIELIDTPGLFSGAATGHSAVGMRALIRSDQQTQRHLAHSDARLFLVDAAISRSDADTVRRMQDEYPPMTREPHPSGREADPHVLCRSRAVRQ